MAAVQARTKLLDPFARSASCFQDVKGYAGSPEADKMSESEFEREMEVRLRELKRQLLQDHLDRRGGVRAVEPVKDSEGQQRDIVHEHTRTLRTTFGEVSLKRLGYGAEGSQSLHPVDAELNLPNDGYSLELRRRLSREVARGSFEEATEAIHETTGVLVPKRQAEELAARSAQDFEEFYAAKRAVDSLEPAEEPILVLSLDGKGIVMRHEDLRPDTQRKAEKRQPHLTPRLSPGEKPHAKRMAVVAAVYTVDRHVRAPEDVFPPPGPRRAPPPKRPRPLNKRVWASVEEDVEPVVTEMFLEAQSRDPEHKREWVVVADGNEQQLRLVKQTAELEKVAITVILDVIHVLEYVWTAALTLHADNRDTLERWVLERMLQILSGRAWLVAAGMRRSATLRKLAKDRRKAVDRAADYLLNHKRFLRYDHYLKRGYPIASGVIEGACRHLVNLRMNRSGARWSLDGAEAVLRLRSLIKSGDFDEYWVFHEARERERNHLSEYADRRLPLLAKPSATSTLRRIK